MFPLGLPFSTRFSFIPARQHEKQNTVHRPCRDGPSLDLNPPLRSGLLSFGPCGTSRRAFLAFSDLSDVLTSVGGHRKIDTYLARNNCVGFK
jgi:hypothetical protein